MARHGSNAGSWALPALVPRHLCQYGGFRRVCSPGRGRRYRIRGLAKNLAFDVMMKVNVLIDRGEAFHVDTLDLYSVRARNGFIS